MVSSTVVGLIIFLLVGMFAVGAGLYVRLHGIPGNVVTWQKDLITWQVIDARSFQPSIVDDVKRCWSRVQSSTMIGMGIAILLDVVGNAVIVWATARTLQNDFLLSGQLFLASLYLSIVVGSGLGYIYGVWQARRTTHGVSYADMRQRRLSDYRLPLLPWIPVILIACVVTLTFILAPHFGPTLQLEIANGSSIVVPNTIWTLSALPVVMLLILLTIEALLARIASLSRLLVTRDPKVAVHADDMLRATSIGTIQAFEFVIIAILGMAQLNVMENNLWSAHFWHIGNRPYFLLVQDVFWLIVLVQTLGFLLLICRGRLGGSISGWPWRPGIAR